MIKGAAKAQNLQGINTTRKNSKKHYQIFEKNTTEMQKKTLPLIKKSLADF